MIIAACAGFMEASRSSDLDDQHSELSEFVWFARGRHSCIIIVFIVDGTIRGRGFLHKSAIFLYDRISEKFSFIFHSLYFLKKIQMLLSIDRGSWRWWYAMDDCFKTFWQNCIKGFLLLDWGCAVGGWIMREAWGEEWWDLLRKCVSNLSHHFISEIRTRHAGFIVWDLPYSHRRIHGLID